MVVLLLIGFYYSKKMESIDDFALAGRGVSWPLILATTAATMIGGGASTGSVSTAFNSGAVIAFTASGWYLAFVYEGILYAPKLRNSNFTTVADFFEYRYGRYSRDLVAIISFIFCIGIVAAQIAAMGIILSATLNISFMTAAIVGTAIVIAYSAMGGMWAVIQTDVFQFVLLTVAFYVAALVGLKDVGGYEVLLTKIPEGFASLSGTLGWGKAISIFIAFFVGELFAPYFVQRMYAAKNNQFAKYGVAGAGMFLVTFLPIVMVTLGFLAKVYVPDVESGSALASLIQVLLPTPVAAIVVSAMLACMMSSCDSILSCCSVIVVNDFLKKHTKKERSQKQTLNIVRSTTVIVGAAGLLLALAAPNVIDLLLYSYSTWAPVVVVPFIIGLGKNYNENVIYSIFLSMITGLVVSLSWLLSGQPLNLDSSVAGLIAAIIMYVVSKPLTKNMTLKEGFIPITDTLVFNENKTI